MPTTQTIMLLVPSVDVTKGEPHPFRPTLHPLEIVGGVVAVMRKVAELNFAGPTSNIRALVRPVGGSRLGEPLIGNMEGTYRRNDTTKVIAIN